MKLQTAATIYVEPVQAPKLSSMKIMLPNYVQ
jgi:hypothetical protein